MRLIFSISFLIISGALFFVFTDPLYGDVKNIKTEVATYTTALSNSTDLQKTRDDLINVYKNVTKEDKENLAHFLPTTIDNIQLILEVEKIANLYGMPVKDISFDSKGLEQAVVNSDNTTTSKETVVVSEKQPADFLPYGVFPMSFVVEGRYDTFITFLKDLEKNLRLIDVKSISFSVPSAAADTKGGVAAPDLTSTNVYSFTLKIETYWLK
jgi:hypothetical protein